MTLLTSQLGLWNLGLRIKLVYREDKLDEKDDHGRNGCPFKDELAG